MASNDQDLSRTCFLEWMNIQKLDLEELLQALALSNGAVSNEADREISLTELTEKILKHFQDYMDKRTQLARNDVSPFFAPTWNSSLENSLLWVAGCRPSIYIRLVYALCGSQVEAELLQYLQGTGASTSTSASTSGKNTIGDLSSKQLDMVNSLHLKTIREEEKLTTQLASLQESIADDPIAVFAKGHTEMNREFDGDAARALEDHDKGMVKILQEADKLRLNTLKELIRILNPVQAVDYLASSKQLKLCVHLWGQQRDHTHGRIN